MLKSLYFCFATFCALHTYLPISALHRYRQRPGFVAHSHFNLTFLKYKHTNYYIVETNLHCYKTIKYLS